MSIFFFFNDTATTEIYTLSLHDALPICGQTRQTTRMNTIPTCRSLERIAGIVSPRGACGGGLNQELDRKSTRLNSSHLVISYAVFCLKKKKIYTRVEVCLVYSIQI